MRGLRNIWILLNVVDATFAFSGYSRIARRVDLKQAFEERGYPRHAGRHRMICSPRASSNIETRHSSGMIRRAVANRKCLSEPPR